jgi:hypothetical protein
VREARVERVGGRGEEQALRVVDAEEHRRECGEDVRGEVFDPTRWIISHDNATK